MADKIQWICEACDSSNTVDLGAPAICRFCRLTYDVNIAREEPAAQWGEESPAVEAAVELLAFDPEDDPGE
ncbi:MAG: hypothetical protein ACRD16_14505 [Thermoanaerobaculia bacterium]